MMHLLIRKLVGLSVGVLLVAGACSGGGSTPAAPTAVPPTATTAPTATPVPTHTPAPTDTLEPAAASGDACVVGTWELSDMGGYMSSIIPATADAEFTFVGQDGRVRYVFSADGNLTFEADNFVVRFSMSVSGASFTMEVGIDGSGTATYTAGAAGSLILSNSEAGDLNFYATLDGAEIFSGTSGEMASLFGVSEDAASTTLTYQCAGDTLTYTPPVENAQPVVLTRVGP